MNIATIALDPSMSLKEATQSDVVRQKLDMDALRSRLGDSSTKQEKLREACEGFEAIFLQKMWEQMRKTVPKEGYLHSKDEETYQSLFDIELCKKMATAGGIGLADMLYEQLSQQLENTGRTTTPSSYRAPLNIAPTTTLLPQPPESAAVQAKPEPAVLKAEDLYSPLPQETPAEAANASGAMRKKGESLILGALDEIKVDLGLAPREKGVAAKEWAEERKQFTGTAEPDATVVNASGPGDAYARTDRNTAERGNTDGSALAQDKKDKKAVDPALASWQGGGPVSATPRPFSPFAGRAAKVQDAEKADESKKSGRRGMAPDETLWPVAGEQGVVSARFGWEDDPATGKRRWNSGVSIDAPAGASVRAVLDGTVVYAGHREGAGNSVVLEHKGGYRSYYGNLMPSDVRIGDKIRHGSEFAKIASQAPSSTNEEKSASLHFELKKGEMALNPEVAIPRMTTASRQ